MTVDVRCFGSWYGNVSVEKSYFSKWKIFKDLMRTDGFNALRALGGEPYNHQTCGASRSTGVRQFLHVSTSLNLFTAKFQALPHFNQERMREMLAELASSAVALRRACSQLGQLGMLRHVEAQDRAKQKTAGNGVVFHSFHIL